MRVKNKRKRYVLTVLDRKSGNVVQIETRKSEQAFDRLWCKALTNVNTVIYKMNVSVEEY